MSGHTVRLLLLCQRKVTRLSSLLMLYTREGHIYIFSPDNALTCHYETGSCVHFEFPDKASSCSADPKLLLTFHAYFSLIYQVSDCSQSQYATLRPGVWSEHLHGSAASVSDHLGGGGLSWTWPWSLHSGLEVISCVILVYFTSHWWSSCIFFPSVLHLRWILCHHIFSLLYRWALQSALQEALCANGHRKQSSRGGDRPSSDQQGRFLLAD